MLKQIFPARLLALALTLLCCGASASSAETFRVATYNLENYLDQPTASRHFVKSAEAKAKIRESIRAMNSDVLALEEMGTTNALLELRESLKGDGLDFPFWEYVQGFDTNIHVAVLSKLPIIARRPHTNEFFLLDGKRFAVKRGFAELDIQAAPDFVFTLIAAHLKSHLATPEADEAEERMGEAKVLRGIINSRLGKNPNARLVVLGDFNDTKNSDSTREIIGRGKFRLADTRPAEHNGDNVPGEPRSVAWTYYYGVSDTYSRIDYILLSPAMKNFWRAEETFIPKLPDWGVGSDHRPIIASFATGARR